MSITSNIANVASALTTGTEVNNLNAEFVGGQSASDILNLITLAYNQANSAYAQANTGGGGGTTTSSGFEQHFLLMGA